MMINLDRENGQAIVLIAIAFIALVSFAGLAVDGGMIFSDRRHAQNAADAGSLAGGGVAALRLENEDVWISEFDCESNAVKHAILDAMNAAKLSIEENGYHSDNFKIIPYCEDQIGSYLDITTQVTKTTTTALIQIIYDKPVKNVVDATTHIEPRMPWAYGNAIVALNDEEESCNDSSAGGIKLGGTGDTYIEGGGIWTNSCLVAGGSCFTEVNNGSITYVGGMNGTCPYMDPTPQPDNNLMEQDAWYIEPPDCGDKENPPENVIFADHIRVSNNETIDLNPEWKSGISKLYCLENSKNAFIMTGGVLTGTHVTIYLVNNGDVEINGGILNLTSPPKDPDPSPAIAGVIFYANPDEPSIIDVTGNISSTYTGLIYGPAADIKITGNEEIGPTLNTQIIGWNVTLLGTASININFDKSWFNIKPATLDLEE